MGKTKSKTSAKNEKIRNDFCDKVSIKPCFVKLTRCTVIEGKVPEVKTATADKEKASQSSSSSGKSHRKKHQFPCEECEKSFKSKYSLTRHRLKAHHEEEDENEIAKIVIHCPLCSEALSSEKELENHLEEIHKVQPDKVSAIVRLAKEETDQDQDQE